jgi:hypothetical protein
MVAVDWPEWRTTGPPADHPDDAPPPAPGPEFFFIPGHYGPAGDHLTWTPGFWALVQPGWEWIPARWIRRPNRWEFREGGWVRDLTAVIVNTRPRRRLAARPAHPDPQFGVFDLENGSADADIGTDRLPSLPGTANDRDPIDEAERSGVPPVISGQITGMPYHVIRPPGTFPYGPAGVVVPGAVPPFVRRILDRVLP